jgi:hypothetical protein
VRNPWPKVNESACRDQPLHFDPGAVGLRASFPGFASVDSHDGRTNLVARLRSLRKVRRPLTQFDRMRMLGSRGYALLDSNPARERRLEGEYGGSPVASKYLRNASEGDHLGRWLGRSHRAHARFLDVGLVPRRASASWTEGQE